mmetsp:Transcript_33391/g.80589  ORF Transcript_33391/g.80589 Transcript_33391/m.80589 type:complete len:289 (+) Transcript_33391:384-1250(+)
MLLVQAIGVAVPLVRLVGADLPQRLVVGHISGEASHLVQRKLHVAEQCQESLQVVVPAQPPAMCCVQVQTHPRCSGHQLGKSIRDPLFVRGNRRWIAAVRVTDVRREVRQTVRLHHQDYRHLAFKLLKHRHEWLHIVFLVLCDAISAIPLGVIVAGAIRLLRTADLTVGCLSIAITVGKVIPNQHHQLRRGLGRGVCQDTLHRTGVCTSNLLSHINPVRGRHILHLLQVLLGHPRRSRNGPIKLLGIRGVPIEALPGKGIAGCPDRDGEGGTATHDKAENEKTVATRT